MKENKRKKRHKTLEDFAKAKEEEHDQTKAATDDNPGEVRPDIGTTLPSAPMPQEIVSLVRQEVQKAVAGILVQTPLDNSKHCPKKKRNPVHIRNPDFLIVLKFRKGNEPLRETMSRVIRAAGKYLEMTGDTEVQ
jgi:hypothetical protein